MPRDDFYTPTDADELRMENELLAYEVRFLRAMLADPLNQIEEHRTRLGKTREELDRLREENAHFRERRQDLQQRTRRLEKRTEELEAQSRDDAQAKADLVRLLESMSGGATEIVYRRNEVFNELKERYL